MTIIVRLCNIWSLGDALLGLSCLAQSGAGAGSDSCGASSEPEPGETRAQCRVQSVTPTRLSANMRRNTVNKIYMSLGNSADEASVMI